MEKSTHFDQLLLRLVIVFFPLAGVCFLRDREHEPDHDDGDNAGNDKCSNQVEHPFACIAITLYPLQLESNRIDLVIHVLLDKSHQSGPTFELGLVVPIMHEIR